MARRACRRSTVTHTFVGRIMYFVLAEPADDLAVSRLTALGLTTAPQKFAMVEAYEAKNVQEVVPKEPRAQDRPWHKAAADAIGGANIFPGVAPAESFQRVLERA